MTWNRETVHKELLKVFGQHKQTEVDVSETSEIVADLGIDSLGVMEVLADIEDTFKLQIPDDALREINTIGDVATAILTRLERDGKLEA
ncbi:acyl carrier protein [Polyangium jinanense]|uniref:Acyl carrier protein n=1 Tax=Polyangium jinanense TaxID=2829994 RepID=A0A9X3X0M7_9BACT|nr:acyl carrier protein [Polyangium jinanense]MDC3952545.1 acyl carrier protein [Polyangium jinanense]MDC3980173.1 acyl carrier protein [Polyangium jinanense]